MKRAKGEEEEEGGNPFPSFSSPPFSHVVLVMRTSVSSSPLFNRGLSFRIRPGKGGGPENEGDPALLTLIVLWVKLMSKSRTG